jgi:hydroxymethylglutaryl-CoA lyase
MSDLPRRADVVEEGPREGMQSEPPGIPTGDKIALIEALAAAGLREISCAAFVSPSRLPQMADAEAIAAGLRRRAGVIYTGLWLNAAGFERAAPTALDKRGIIVTSASETFGIRNNNRNRAELLDEQRKLLDLYAAHGVPSGPGYVFTAFGCNYEGAISPKQAAASVGDLLALWAERGVPPQLVYLCDTVGAAAPLALERTLGEVRARWPDLAIGLHLHDTRGLGLANALAGLRMGVARFDSSVGGLGGCPFAGNPAAAGNICTEDLVLLLEEMGVDTGVDLEALLEAARLAERIVGHPLPGKAMKGGALARFRSG